MTYSALLSVIDSDKGRYFILYGTDKCKRFAAYFRMREIREIRPLVYGVSLAEEYQPTFHPLTHNIPPTIAWESENINIQAKKSQISSDYYLSFKQYILSVIDYSTILNTYNNFNQLLFNQTATC